MKRLSFVVVLLLLSWVPPAAGQIFEPVSARVVPRYDPEAEALRSLLLPGWSQMRQGADVRGTVHMTIAFVSAVFMFGVMDVPVLGDSEDNFGQVLAGAFYGLNAVVSAFDAHARATESNRENGWDLQESGRRAEPGLRIALVRLDF
jgi:hypothetical protein